MEHFGIRFNHLFTMTNLPIKRFADFLYRRNELEVKYSSLQILFISFSCLYSHFLIFFVDVHLKAYMQLLVENFNPKTLDGLMCRNSLSIDYKGRLFDCDFNQVWHRSQMTSHT